LAEACRQSGLVPPAVAVVAEARRRSVPVLHCTAENLPGMFGVNRNARLFAAARRGGMENRPGSGPVRPISEFEPMDRDVVLPRLHGLSPMTGSPLHALLTNEGITTVVIMGVSLNIAIPNLVFDAVNRGYGVVVVSDAVVGVPIEYGREVMEHSLSLVSLLASSDQIVEVWRDGAGARQEYT
jgi:nicotinamidase-related amidase